MIYSSIENLPMRLFLKITSDGSLDLLGEGTEDEKQEAWNNIIEEFKEVDPDGIFKKYLNKTKQMEHFVCKYNSVKLSLWCLKIKKSEDLIKHLSSLGYVIRDDYYLQDIERAERYSVAIKDKIKQINDELTKENEEEKINLDKIIIRFNVIMGFNIADSNAVTVSQYYAIKDEVEEKQKELERLQKKNKR